MLETFSVNESATNIRQKFSALVQSVNSLLSAPASDTWVVGNAKIRVSAALDGRVYQFNLRTSGAANVNPASGDGPANWSIENRGPIPFYSSIGPYLEVGQMVYFGGRLYQLLLPYSVDPTPGSDVNWKDIFADAAIGNTGDAIDPVDPDPDATGPTDGTVTSEPFEAYDASQWAYTDNGTGTPPQQWSQSTALAGYSGLGYAVTNAETATQATSADFFLNGLTSNDNDRKAYLRVKGLAGQSVGGSSHGNGTYGEMVLATNDWEWVEFPEAHKAFDRQFQVYGLSPNVAVDKLLLTTQGNTDIPTDAVGFRSA